MSGPMSLQPNFAVDASSPQRRAETIEQAARQLEGVFVGMMFEEMSKTVGDEDGLFPSTPGSEMYQQWFRSEVSSSFSAGGGLGLGDLIARQMGGGSEASKSGAQLPVASLGAVPDDPRAPAPVQGRVSSDFGHRIHPVTGERDAHRGVDIATPEGSWVRAPYGGRVVEVKESGPLGLHVVVDHGGGYRSLYGHLSGTSVRPGSWVSASEALGRSGQSGRATGPHLHFGVYKDGEAIDPRDWVRLEK